MSTLVTLPSGQVVLYRKKKPETLPRLLQQVTKTCRQFFGQVDIDPLRNQIKNLSNALLSNRRSEIARFRNRAYKEFGTKSWLFLCYYELIRSVRGMRHEVPGLYRWEKILFLALLLSLLSPILQANTLPQLKNASLGEEILTEDITSSGPKNWLDGNPELNGFRKDAVSGPFQYAKDSGYEFAATKDRLIELVESGTLVELEETNSLRFSNVSRPYVLPVVAEFVYRLADQYNFGQKCGPLVLTGAARDVAFQQTLGNGSAKSVHPAGMAVDLKSTDLTPRCQAWLEGTLLEIEAAKRIDFTKEISRKAPHYHVSVATHEYEAWLNKRRTVDSPEVDALRIAMFYEGGSNETTEGYKAIGWVIRNRVASKDYPNTIQAVVAEDSIGKTDGGCQFSFMCDGKPEDRYELCRTANGKLTSYWRFRCDMRWEQVTVIAKAILTETKDPTGGATLYYATWMNPKPDWAKPRAEVWANGKTVSLPHGDFAHEPVEIGNHYFGCSRFAGKGVCKRNVS
jgi:spore germination cell wall hydrolase CwlJ-like protein